MRTPVTEGERWTREQLVLLRERRFGVAATAAFLWASWRRSASVRRARPLLARRAWTWMAAGAATWMALAAAGREPFHRRRRAGMAWWALTAVMLDWHLGMLETPEGRSRSLSTADALTLARAWLVPVAFDSPTPLVCVFAAATDALDGPLARRAGPTRAGRDLEGLVDACFVIAALRGTHRRGQLGSWVVALELLRLGAGVAAAVALWFARFGPPPDDLVHAARATTALRAGGLVLAGTGRRRTAEALLVAGSLLSLGLLARAAA